MHNRLDGILRLLDKNKDFYDGTATECPAVLLSELMAEDDPVLPFCESLAIHQVEPQDAQALRKQFDDIGNLSKQVFGRLAKRFNLSLDEEDKGNFSKFLTEYVKCSQPKGMTRHEWVWAFAYNSIISWIIFCYTIELNEENCLGKAMEDPKFRIETAEARIALMNLHQRWDRRFRGARPDVRNCIDFFGSLLLRVSLLVADSRNFFDYDTGRGKGSCEVDIDTALTADTRHAPYNKLVPAVASHWIELARTRVISTLAATFRKRANACKDNPEAFKLWKDLYAIVCPQNDDLKLDYTPDEVSVIVRLAKLAADYSHDCQKAVEKYDNVLPLATIQHSEDLGVDVCDIRPLRNHPFKWRGAVAAWFERLKLKVMANPDSQAILDLIDRTSLAALEYYRVLSTRAPYLRGETNQLPPPFKDKNGKIFDVGQALTGSVANCLLSSMSKVIENLPALNTPDGGYPFDRLDEMFKAINLFTTMMNHCEEENTSVESDCFGQAVADTVLLHRLVCPKKNAQGRYVLERDLIAQAFGDFRKSILAAAWSVRRKAEKRASGKIDLCGDNSRFGYSGPGGATGELVEYAYKSPARTYAMTYYYNCKNSKCKFYKDCPNEHKMEAICNIDFVVKQGSNQYVAFCEEGEHIVQGLTDARLIRTDDGDSAQKSSGEITCETLQPLLESACDAIEKTVPKGLRRPAATKYPEPFGFKRKRLLAIMPPLQRKTAERLWKRWAEKGIEPHEFVLPGSRDMKSALNPFLEEFISIRKYSGEHVSSARFADDLGKAVNRFLTGWQNFADGLSADFGKTQPVLKVQAAVSQLLPVYANWFNLLVHEDDLKRLVTKLTDALEELSFEIASLPKEAPAEPVKETLRAKGVCEFSGNEVHRKIYIRPGEFVKVGSRKYGFTGNAQWEIVGRFLRSIKAGDGHEPGRYPVVFTSNDYNKCKGGCRALVNDFIERQPVAQKERNRRFEDRARFKVELLGGKPFR